MTKRLLTTAEIAEIFRVTQDAVLKWVRTGKIGAVQTPGGHYRIPSDQIPEDITGSKMTDERRTMSAADKYCWEFHSQAVMVPDVCLQCIVYRSMARKCYVINQSAHEYGFTEYYCPGSCEECAYYQDQNIDINTE